jgi:hypothetical protein
MAKPLPLPVWDRQGGMLASIQTRAKLDELVGQLRRFRPPGQPDTFARIAVILLGLRQHGHPPAINALPAA